MAARASKNKELNTTHYYNNLQPLVHRPGLTRGHLSAGSYASSIHWKKITEKCFISLIVKKKTAVTPPGWDLEASALVMQHYTCAKNNQTCIFYVEVKLPIFYLSII
jgi:hypothetical protein